MGGVFGGLYASGVIHFSEENKTIVGDKGDKSVTSALITEEPTVEPTTAPTTTPTVEPTATPTVAPTKEPKQYKADDWFGYYENDMGESITIEQDISGDLYFTLWDSDYVEVLCTGYLRLKKDYSMAKLYYADLAGTATIEDDCIKFETSWNYDNSDYYQGEEYCHVFKRAMD